MKTQGLGGLIRRRHLVVVFAALLASLLALSHAAWAVPIITTNESGMDGVFSQSSFGVNTIDIRFNASVTFFSNDLLSIDTPAELIILLNLGPNGPFGVDPTVNIYFVDVLNTCDGIINPAFIGCAFAIGNNDFVVESDFAAGNLGTALNSHELGHDLGLFHVDFPPNNLMNPFLQSDTTLTATQVHTILISPLVQMDAAGQRFVAITPILIASVPVPEPGTLVLVSLGITGFFLVSRRKNICAPPNSRLF